MVRHNQGTGRMRKGRLRFRMLTGGWLFLLIFVLLLFAAWNTGTNLLFIILGGVVSFLLLSIVLGAWNLRGIQTYREAPGAAHRGEAFLVGVRIENHRRLMPAIGIRVAQTGHMRHSLAHVIKIPARRTASMNVDLCFEKRGVHLLPAFEVCSTFPFGLLECRRRYTSAQEVVVYPRVSRVRSSAVETMSGGNYVPRSAVQDGDEFFGLREYIPGDDLRRIAWRVSARMGVWMVRENSRESARYVVFALDTRWIADSEDFEQLFEEAIELVASLAATLLARQYTVAIITPGQMLEGGEGASHERRMLDMLARLEPADPAQHGGFVDRALAMDTPEASLVFVTPDKRVWGEPNLYGHFRALDPREVVHA